MRTALKIALSKSIRSACPDADVDKLVKLLERPKNSAHGDLALPCFEIAKQKKMSPADCAKELAAKISLPTGFSQVTPLGPFLNFSFARQAIVEDCLAPKRLSQLQAAVNLQVENGTDKHGQKVILEYSSPNIAKPFHVGHLRATLLGNSLDRVYRYLGADVVSINHLGDWGTQFGFVWAGCELWGKPTQNSVLELVDIYRKATQLKEDQERGKAKKDPDVNEMARKYFLALEGGEASAKDFWSWCLKISLEYFEKTYARFGVRFDHYTGESFYVPMIPAVEKELEKSGLLQVSEGARGIDLGEELGFARIFTPDGRSLYLTRDIAAAKYRDETFKFDQAIYIVGAPQTLHFQQIKGVLHKLGHHYGERIEHVAFGHVLGIKTRGSGEFVELNDFLDEAISRSLEVYQKEVSKRPEGLDEQAVAEGVALSAIIFSNLSRNRMKDVNFDWKHAIQFQGDTGPYLLYAYTRVNGIKEKASAQGLNVPKELNDAKLLVDDISYTLVSQLADFDEAINRAADDKDPFHLAQYALDLAHAFSKAYSELHVVGEEKHVAEARLYLFECARVTLGKTLELLGIEPLDRM